MGTQIHLFQKDQQILPDKVPQLNYRLFQY